MTVHIPNGMVPVAALFMAAGCFFSVQALIWAAFYNLAIIFLAMPGVMITGAASWKFRYKGASTPLFKTKIFCSILLFVVSGAILLWQILRPINPQHLTIESWAMVAAYAALLAPTARAGALGGKLIFAARKKI